MKKRTPPLLGFCAWSGTGKTTLLTRIIPLLRKKGLRIAIVKHAHHRFDIDHPGKDSYVLREAGAGQVVIASQRRMAYIREFEDTRDEPSLQDALHVLDPDNLDLVLVEGFKHEHFPKIELYRHDIDGPLLYTGDPDIFAIATDKKIETGAGTNRTIAQLDINEPDQVATYILNYIDLA